ncbi:MAG: glycosyltransferase [Solirubrobacterales bacterium]
MRVVLFAHGTRGDVGPLVALGWTLAREGHEITVAVPEEFRGLATAAGLRTAPLPLNMMAWLSTSEGQKLLHTGGYTFLRRWAHEYARHADALDEAQLAAAQGADALISNHVTADRSLALSDALGIPVAFFIPFPLAPSREYSPLTTTSGGMRSPWLRLATHKLDSWIWWRQVSGPANEFRAKLGLPPSRKPTVRRLMEDPSYLAVYALSPSLFPRPTDWPDHIKVTAGWKLPSALRQNLDEELPADLVDWLDAGDPPVFLGFGSMPVLEPQRLLGDIVSVTGELGVRAIVSENCVAAEAAESLPANLRVVGTVDHDDLFPRCAAAVHHGGIGSLSTSLGADLPTMVCSVLGDQPWWGEHMNRLGTGSHIPFRKLTRTRLHAGLRGLQDPSVKARAADIGSAIRAEGDGLPVAGRLFSAWLDGERG